VDFDDVIQRAAARKAAVASVRGVTLDLAGTAGTVSGDGDILLRAVDGLIEHAIMASPPGSTVRIRMTGGTKPAVTVADSGPGLRSDAISGVFQRFYRSNQPRARSEESGLGLSIARAVALSHGGSLEYTGNAPGASFTLSLPAAS
jgi:signal transduction histidine kinase